MSTLQISLAIVGGLVLAAVVIYNAWVTRRSAPRIADERAPAEELTTRPEDAPGRLDAARDADGGRIEPVLGEGRPQAREADPQDPTLSVTEDGAAPEEPLRATPITLNHVVAVPERRPGLDALIDVIAPLGLDTAVSGDALLVAMPSTRRVGSKPFAVEGLNDATGEWELPKPGQRYGTLQAGVQLANRSGALNDIEFSEFVVKTQAFADAVGAAPDFPDMRAEVARARELDAFASAHDAQLGFTVRARRAAWSPGYVSQHAARLGFVAGVLPGRMVLPVSQAGLAPVLSLSFDAQAAMAEDPELSALREVTLTLEVTHVPRSERPFQRLRDAAAALAADMDGVVTDDAGHPLSDEALNAIGSDVETLYDALDARDLAAGSPQARRLFS